MNEQLLLLLVFSPFIIGPLLNLFPKKSIRYLGLTCATYSLGLFLIVARFSLMQANQEVIQVFIPWVPEAYLNLSFLADGLALFFSLLITGMGTLIFFYANFFMDLADERLRQFYCNITIFMGAMLGAVLADNFMLLFLFWEVTGVMSYLLISYHYESSEARIAARTAFLVTSFASLCMMLGFILIAILDGTLEISTIAEKGLLVEEHPSWVFLIISLILIGVYAKSAQFPFHFWLPDAMKAPTPVSAYLHSATMVKLGIYLLARIYAIFIESELWFPLVTTLSLVSILLGGLSALFAMSLKRILAYATISQLGFFITFYGTGIPQGLQYDYIHIFNHALYKGSLFMLVGVLAHAAGVTAVNQLGGLAKKLPLWTAIFLLSIGAMVGIPGTVGFLSKELLLADMIVLFNAKPIGAVIFFVLFLGLLLKVAFSYRLVHYLFFVEPIYDNVVNRPPRLLLLLSPFVLSAIALTLGIWPQGFEELSNLFYTEGLHKSISTDIAVTDGLLLTISLSLSLFLGGILLFFWTRRYEKHYNQVSHFDFSINCNHFFEHLPAYGRRVTKLIHSSRPEINLRWVFAVLGFGVLLLLPLQKTSIEPPSFFDRLALVQLLTILSSILLLFFRSSMNRLICLSLVGFLTTYYYVLKNAPDLAMTQMVVEVATLFLFVLLFSKIQRSDARSFSWMKVFISLTFGCSISLLLLHKGVLTYGESLNAFFIKNAVPLAKGSNVVNTIIVDFRALDTLGEISVIAAAVLGVRGLLKKVYNPKQLEPLIPTPLLSAVMPVVCVIASLFSIYILVRGHNSPGGGFIASVVLSISFILLEMAVKNSKLFYVERYNAMHFLFFGLFLALTSSLISLPLGNGFFTAEFLPIFPLLNTPFLFDLGIFLLVAGAIARIVHLMRMHILGGEIR